MSANNFNTGLIMAPALSFPPPPLPFSPEPMAYLFHILAQLVCLMPVSLTVSGLWARDLDQLSKI
jgi:hypothetical protein